MLPRTSVTKTEISQGHIETSRMFADAVPGGAFTTPCTVLEAPAFGQYYVYCSGPKAASADRPKYKGTGKPRGAHDYHSMMWDPRIYRGPTYKTFKQSENERCKRKQLEDADTNRMQRKKAYAKRQEKNLGGITRPKTPTNQSNKIGLEDMGVQTDRFLEEITDEVKEKEMCTQTDHIFDLTIPLTFCPIKLGVDMSTQIMPWELFQFDKEAKPIVTAVVGKIIEQALFESMEEAELESLMAQQRIHEEKHRVELMRLDRLHKREQKITEERQRLIVQRQKEVENERETETRINATLYSANYLKNMPNSALNELRHEGFMTESDGLEESFIPWLHSQSIIKIALQDESNILLDELIQAVVEKREAEVAEGIWREISAQGYYESDMSYGPTLPPSAYSGYVDGYDGEEED